MKSRKILFLLLAITLPLGLVAQDFASNIFIRAPQVVNYNFKTKTTNYTAVLSAGIGITHQAKFIEFATFITTDDIHGFYSFFGSSLKSKSLDAHWNFHTNWYGELTYLPEQNELFRSTQYAAGFCFFLNHSFKWGAIGFPLCIGLVYDNENLSLNTRSIINFSIKL